MNDIVVWFETQWHIVAPILISVLPSLGVVGGIINSAKNLIRSNKSLIKDVISEVKNVNEKAFDDLFKQVNGLIKNLSSELNTLRKDNQLMAQIVSEVILSKNVNNQVKEKVVLLASQMSSPIIKNEVVETIETKAKETTTTIELPKVEEVKLEETQVNTYVPIND